MLKNKPGLSGLLLTAKSYDVYGCGTKHSTSHGSIRWHKSNLISGSSTIFFDLAEWMLKKVFQNYNPDSTPGNYTLRPGSYSIRVRVDGPSNAWESGDYDANAAIFSGTRIAVINPQIQNEWSAGMGRNPQDAMANATAILLQKYPGINPDDVHTSAVCW